MTIKPNPYVYPYIPFADLSQKELRSNFTKKVIITDTDLKERVSGTKSPQPNLEGSTAAEQILSIFQDENYRFGPREFIAENHDLWIKKLSYFIEINLPIEFTILGFPFKMPVSLKTNRTLPDMGETLSLLRLYHISKHIQTIYKPGAIIHVFTEGAFGNFSGVSKVEWVSYREYLKTLVALFGWNTLQIHDLSDMEQSVGNFNDLYENRIVEFERLYNEKNPEFMKRFDGAYPSIVKIVSTRKYSDTVLMDVYNDALTDEDVSDEVVAIRREIENSAISGIPKYFAYLAVRDDLNYLETVVPHYIPLTVSPKPNRLGIIPVNEHCQRLPYHGVVVRHPDSTYTIEYLIDIKRDGKTYTPVYITTDSEDKPFYYQQYDE